MITTATRRAIAQAYRDGVKVDVIALTYRIDRSMVSKIAAAEGVPLREVGRPRKAVAT